MYAIVKTGGKQYRVEQGSSLLVERLRADEGAKVALAPLLFVDGSKVLDGDAGVKVEARVVAHERGPKLRVVKFKPKRGYKRRTGHRQELTRLEVTSIKGPATRTRRAAAPKEEEAAAKPKAAPKRQAAAKPKAAPKRRASTTSGTRRTATPTSKKKESTSDGS
jgi:large subunit ribosomal protein L21